MQVLALTFIKLSCMFFYRRIFRVGSNKIFDAAMVGVVVIIVLWAISFFFAFTFMCGTHFNYLWTSLANEAKCAKTMMLQQGFAISDVITDFFVLLFPIPLVWILSNTMGSRELTALDLAIADVGRPQASCHMYPGIGSPVSQNDGLIPNK